MNLAPLLIFAWGNPSRGDDALGPLFVEAVEALQLPDVECLIDFQLQVEHALDLVGRERVLFVDASIDVPAPFKVSSVEAVKDFSFTTHAMTPQAVLAVCEDLHPEATPPCWLLAIRGEGFELGGELQTSARRHLAAALAWFANGAGLRALPC